MPRNQDTINRPAYPAASRAFSLVELLVVVALMVLMSAIGLVGFNQLGRSTGVGASVDIVSELVDQARIEAVSSGRPTLVAIDVDSSSDTEIDPEARTRWRRLAVFRKDAADPTATPPTAEGWVLVSKATVLTKGTYFYEDSSQLDQTDATPTRLSFNTPGVQDGSTGSQCLVVKFNSVGHVIEPNARLIFTEGVLQGGSFVNAKTDLDAARRGFILRKNGRPTFFNNTEEMDNLIGTP